LLRVKCLNLIYGNGNAHKKIMKMLDHCQVEAIILMAAGIFTPYTGVDTSIMIFIKGGKTEKVWLYTMAADGYSLDDKIMPTPYNNDIANN
jgi:type I restriction enzyme M protein